MRIPLASEERRRAYTEIVGLEWLLVHTNEIVRFGLDESWADVPCTAPNQSETCRLAFGRSSSRRRRSPRQRGSTAHGGFPLERLVELGRRTSRYPACIADPNLGLSCSTQLDDSVGQQIYLGLAGSTWKCPGDGYVNAETAIPKAHGRCRVICP